MPDHAFDITTATPRITLQDSKGEVRFTVSNALGQATRVNAYVEVEDRGQVDWVAVDGDFPRAMDADHTFELLARVDMPETLAKGHYRMRLVVASTESPDTERAVSQWVSLENSTETPDKFPWWIVALVAGVVVLAVGGYALYEWLEQTPEPAPDASPPQVPVDASPPEVPADAAPPPLGLEEHCTPGARPCRDELFCSPTLNVCLKQSLAVGDLCDPAAPQHACPRNATCKQQPAGQPHRCWPKEIPACQTNADCNRPGTLFRMQCVNGRCKLPTFEPQPVGRCRRTSDCASGLACISGRCIRLQIPKGIIRERILERGELGTPSLPGSR